MDWHSTKERFPTGINPRVIAFADFKGTCNRNRPKHSTASLRSKHTRDTAPVFRKGSRHLVRKHEPHLQEYSKTKDAEKKINEDKDVAKKEYDDRANIYKKDLDEINRLDQALSGHRLSVEARQRTSRDREEKVTALKKMEQEINEFRTAREKQLQEQAEKCVRAW